LKIIQQLNAETVLNMGILQENAPIKQKGLIAYYVERILMIPLVVMKRVALSAIK